VSLRYQINLKIFLSAVFVLMLGAVVAIWQARNAVNKEVDSSINLAVQLIKMGSVHNGANTADSTHWLSSLSTLNETRHLTIQLITPAGKTISLIRKSSKAALQDSPPEWFVHLVAQSYADTEYPLSQTEGTLIIQANPLDEISEVWHESITFFTLLLLLTLLTFVLVNLLFNKALDSIEQIVQGVQRIETGEYQQKLPEFCIREYANIAKAVNHMSEELNKAQQENRSLTKNSLDIQEEERQRLAQELHDELGQSLTAIKVMAVTAAHPKSDTIKITASITDICDHLMVVVRSMMHQLHPLILTELGLKAALDDMLNHWQERNPTLAVSIECSDEVDSLEKKMTIQIFRVVQECLTNIVRHANAEQVSIKLTMENQTEKKLHLLVQDDGQGCDLAKVNAGFGLRGMQERIKTLGGELMIVSQPEQGMQITAQIPLK